MPPGSSKRGSSPLLITACWAALAAAHLGAALGWQTTGTWFYPLVWWPYVILADLYGARLGVTQTLLAPPSRMAVLALLSVPFWLLFELLNLRLQNWYYVGVPESWLLRHSGAVLSFATVLPLMAVTSALLRRGPLKKPLRIPRLRVTRLRLWIVQLCGVLFLLLPMAWPRYFFPLVWGFLALLLDPANYRAGRPSLLRDLERGDGRRIAALLAGGLICGGLWEFWNHLATARWIYTVPFLTGTKWFEMPPLGFLGFPALAVEGFVAFHWAAGWWRGAEGRTVGKAAVTSRAVAIAALLTLSVAGLWGMDRHTVAAFAPTLDGVRPLSEAQRNALREHGIGTVRRLALLDDGKLEPMAAASGIDVDLLYVARDWARLSRHRGIGDAQAGRLWDVGIYTIEALAAETPDSLRFRMGDTAPPPARAQIWIHAARRLPPPSEISE